VSWPIVPVLFDIDPVDPVQVGTGRVPPGSDGVTSVLAAFDATFG